ncbi:hypothetical protein Pint_02265 [Pistacia integerrima]|uniref:Uncharacterized protein n=1 Tax=Pistacia integerrima TaxID=434235 RepID=A0ACC0ZMX3_9ROSI|nr:hypothetical protein Pint_02265 [Pistacia integerrima]
MSIEEYTIECNNLSIRVGLSESNEQITSRYFTGLNQSIRDEMGVVRLYNIEDARQYALVAEKRVSCQWEWKETTTTNKTNKGATNVKRSDKGKSIVPYEGQNNFGSFTAKGGSNSQVRCFTCGEKGHISFACPQRRVNLAKFEEELEPVFYKYDEEIEEIDVHLSQGESLVVRKVMTTTIKAEEEDWRRHSIFHTRVVCGCKVCDLVIDGGSMENIISKEVVDKLKLPTITHPHPFKVGWLKKRHEIPVTSQCLVKFTMGGNVEDEALCDIVPMDVGHILVGRPWLFDHDMDHKTKPNTYSFYKDNKRYTLHPLKEKAKQLATKSSTTSKTTRYLSVKKFNAKHEARVSDEGEAFANHIWKIHEDVRAALKASNATYSFSANQHRRMQEFEKGDQVLVHLRREQFPKGTYHKLKSKKFGPCKVFRKISSNAYLIELNFHLRCKLVRSLMFQTSFLFMDSMVFHLPLRLKFNSYHLQMLMLLKKCYMSRKFDLDEATHIDDSW